MVCFDVCGLGMWLGTIFVVACSVPGFAVGVCVASGFLKYGLGMVVVIV